MKESLLPRSDRVTDKVVNKNFFKKTICLHKLNNILY